MRHFNTFSSSHEVVYNHPRMVLSFPLHYSKFLKHREEFISLRKWKVSDQLPGSCLVQKTGKHGADVEKGSFTCILKKIWSNVLKKRAGLDCNVLSLNVYSWVLKFSTVNFFSPLHTNKGFKIKPSLGSALFQGLYTFFVLESDVIIHNLHF